MKILITGASGLLGREIMRAFEDHDLTGLSHSREKTGLRQTDLREGIAFRDLLAELNPDLVINVAAYRDPDYCAENREDALQLNVEPLHIMADCLPTETGIIQISSDYVFDGKNPPYTEDSRRNPVNFYGETKCLAEDAIADRDNALSIRIPVLVGMDDSFEKSGFLYKLVTAARGSEETILDNAHIRYPTWTRDVARALRFAVDKRLSGCIHYSGLDGGTQYTLALKVAELLEQSSANIKPATDPIPRKAPRPLDSHLSPAKIESLGFDTFTPFAEVCKHIVAGLY